MFFQYKFHLRDFPGGPVAKSPPCNAGDASSIPGWGSKMPHITEQLSGALQPASPSITRQDLTGYS